MPKNLIFTDQEVKFLAGLARQGVEFIIVGLSAAALQGAPVVTQDIDLWFRDLSDPKIKQVLKKVGGFYVPPFEMNPPMFGGRDLGLFDIVLTLHGLGDFDREKQKAIDVALQGHKIKVLSLEQIIKSKEATGRDKDKQVLPVLRDSLLVLKNVGNKSIGRSDQK